MLTYQRKNAASVTEVSADELQVQYVVHCKSAQEA
jgi:hypothetical protein